MPHAFKVIPNHRVSYLVRLHADIGRKILDNNKEGGRLTKLGLAFALRLSEIISRGGVWDEPWGGTMRTTALSTKTIGPMVILAAVMIAVLLVAYDRLVGTMPATPLIKRVWPFTR